MQGTQPIAHRWLPAVAALAAGVGIATVAHGQPLHDGDIILRAQADQIQTGALSPAAPGGIAFPQRVFSTRLGLIVPSAASDPGFNSIPGQFTTDARLDVRIVRSARKWNDDARNFCGVPAERIEVRKGSNQSRWIMTPLVDPAAASLGPSIVMGFTDELDGLVHEHPGWWITAPFSGGVYLLEFQLEATGPGATTSSPIEAISAPLWLILNQNAPDAHVADAIRFVESTMVEGSGNLCRCRADVNDDSNVALDDLLDFFDQWSSENGATGADLVTDDDRSGTVDLADLLDFFDRWSVQNGASC